MLGIPREQIGKVGKSRLVRFVVTRGIFSLNVAFFTHMPAPVGEPGGGMANAIVGTLMLIALGALFAVPIGVVAGVYAAEFPGTRLVTDCPVYSPEARESDEIRRLRETDVGATPERAEEADPIWTLERLLSSPTIASKRWIYRQYDTMVRTNTVAPAGTTAGVVRVKGTSRALAVSTDGNGRYGYLKPRRGAMLALRFARARAG